MSLFGGVKLAERDTLSRPRTGRLYRLAVSPWHSV